MEAIQLTRDVEAIEIPSGDAQLLTKGTAAFIAQSLGGTYTIQVPSQGGLFRIGGKDADAIGKEVALEVPASGAGAANLRDQVWAQLKTCYDPEIPVNIVDLGLVYEMVLTLEKDGRRRVDVKMTLTAPGCGMGGSISSDAQEKLICLEGVSDAKVEVVWEPAWNPQMISEAGRERMGMG
jgi:probable FeS assembly SUF system protein SufT